MLRIRRKQFATLDALARARFVRRAVATIAAGNAPRLPVTSRADLAPWVESRLDRATELGIDDEAVALTWLSIAAEYGEAVADDAFVINRLRDPDALAAWPVTVAAIEDLAAGTAVPMGDEP